MQGINHEKNVEKSRSIIFQHLADVGLADIKQQQEMKDAKTVHCG